MLRHRLLALLAATFLVLGAMPADAANPPLIETLKGEKPIQLRSLHISSQVRGGLAQTTVRMVFFNPNARQLEGNLQFPLLDGQDVTGFALDINGKMRSAVPVDKAKGRQVFDEVERQRIDPALLERTQGNNFRLRIYPIAAQGTRTVELVYSESLARVGDDWSYRLPLAYGGGADDFALSLHLAGGAAPPRANQSLGKLIFERDRSGWSAQVARHQFAATEGLQILLPATREAQTFTQTQDGDVFFVAEVPVEGARSARTLPRVVGLLWDSSGSGAGRQLAAELAELDIYFRALDHGEVRLTRLRDRAEPTTSFKIVNGDWSALRKALETTVYDGASALADWKPQSDVGEYLLVSDGLINYGTQAFPVLASGQRLYAINSSASADTGRLRALAERSGGRLVQVSAQSPGAAARSLLTEGPHLGSLRGTGVADLQFESAHPENGLVRIAGRLLAPNATVAVQLTSDGRHSTVMVPVSAEAPEHPMAARLWASYRLAALEADHELQRAQIRRLGQRFGIATRETSLIVLDRVEDYVRHDITPPAELQAEYARLRAEEEGTRKKNRDEHINDIADAYASKVAWWEKSFPKNAPPKPKPERRRESERSMSAPAPAMVSAPPSPAAEAARDSVAAAGDGAVSPVDMATSVESNTILTEAQVARVPVGRNVTGMAAADPSGRANGEGLGMTLKKWTADAPYISRMQSARAEDLYAIYLDEKPAYTNSSAFYLDVADVLLDNKQRDLALRVLSNLAEMDLENRQVLRILGYRLVQAGAPELAIPVFEKVRWLAEDEPQSFRDLGLALAAAGRDQEAIGQLYEVVQRPWDNRFAEIELITLADLNAIVARSTKALDTSQMDPRLLKNLPLDLRVVLTWDADNSDMDLWVTDPNGEKCFYSNTLTYQGGRISDDFTGGYGPEEFSLRAAKPGKYKVEVNYFGDRQQVVAGATTLQVRLTTAFGTRAAKDQWVTLRLKDSSETVFVGEFEVKP